MASSVEEAFVRVQATLQASDYKGALKAAEFVLAQDSSDTDARAVQLHCLLLLSRAAEALPLAMARSGSPNLEASYALWKLNRFTEALDVLGDASDIGTQHLRALLFLRTGRHGDAAAVYQALLPGLRSDAIATAEVATNLVAALVLDGRDNALSELRRFGLTPSAGHELAYNVACAAIVGGRLREAQEHLDLGLRRGQETLLEEGAPEGDIERELAVIRGQECYVASEHGDHATALEGYQKILSLSLQVDPSTVATCANNLLAAKARLVPAAPQPKDVVRKLGSHIRVTRGKCSLTDGLASRLSPGQASALVHNYILVSLLAILDGRPSGLSAADCVSAAEELAQRAPDDCAVMMLAAATRGMLASSEQGIQAIVEWLEVHPQADVLAPALLAAQIACSLQPPQPGRVAELLASEHLPQAVRAAPGVASTRWTLRSFSPHGASAVAADVRDCLQWWLGQPRGTPQADAVCVCHLQLASLAIKAGSPAEAIAAYKGAQDVVAQTSRPAANRARVARGLTALDAKAAAAFLAAPPTGAPMPSTAEVQQAEELDISSARSRGVSVLLGPLVKGSKREQPAVEARGGGAVATRPAKAGRKRRPRYPKGFDPANPGPPPDPERWLPKHERAEFKKRRKRAQRSQPAIKGAQGLGQVDQTLDKSSVAVEDARPSTSSGPKLPTRPKGSAKRRGKR